MGFFPPSPVCLRVALALAAFPVALQPRAAGYRRPAGGQCCESCYLMVVAFCSINDWGGGRHGYMYLSALVSWLFCFDNLGRGYSLCTACSCVRR